MNALLKPAEVQAPLGVSRAWVYAAAQHARGKLSVKSINNSLIPLRQIMARAVRDGIIASNPAAALGRDDPLALPYEPPSMRYLDVSQASAYLGPPLTRIGRSPNS